MEVTFPIKYQFPPKVFLTIEMEEGNHFGAEAQVAERRRESFVVAFRNIQHEAARGIVMWRSEL
jgi:hypothetical protein